MKRILKIAAAMIALSLLLMPCVLAQDAEDVLEEQLEASGASVLFDDLPRETQALMERLGIGEWTLEAFTSLQPQTTLSTLWDLLSDASSLPSSSALMMLATLLLLAFFEALHPNGTKQQVLFRAVCMLAAVTPLLGPLWQTVQRVSEAVESASVFSLSFAPIYAASLFAQGSTAAATSYQTLMIAAAQGITLLVGQVMLPLAAVTLALGVAGAMDSEHRLGKVGGMVGKTNTWLLTLAMTVFVALLSFQSVLSASADTVGGRMLRFSVAGFVPIVGGSLSEALYTVQGCLSTLRGTIGGFGVVSSALIVLPSLLECVVWDVVLFFVKTTAELFGFDAIASVAEAAKSVIKTLIAVLASSALLMVISVTLVTLGAGGVR